MISSSSGASIVGSGGVGVMGTNPGGSGEWGSVKKLMQELCDLTRDKARFLGNVANVSPKLYTYLQDFDAKFNKPEKVLKGEVLRRLLCQNGGQGCSSPLDTLHIIKLLDNLLYKIFLIYAKEPAFARARDETVRNVMNQQSQEISRDAAERREELIQALRTKCNFNNPDEISFFPAHTHIPGTTTSSSSSSFSSSSYSPLFSPTISPTLSPSCTSSSPILSESPTAVSPDDFHLGLRDFTSSPRPSCLLDEDSLTLPSSATFFSRRGGQ